MATKVMKSFRFDPELYDILAVKAKEENRTLSNLIHTILWSWVKSH